LVEPHLREEENKKNKTKKRQKRKKTNFSAGKKKRKPEVLPKKSSVSLGILHEDHHGLYSALWCQEDGRRWWQAEIIADTQVRPMPQSRSRLLSERTQETLPMERVSVY
jgi:hypothetical protein